MDIDEIKERKAEREKLLKNPVTFPFKVNKSFSEYSSHPITIPRRFYPFLEFHGIAGRQEARITFPDGSISAGYIHKSKSGWREYYQIRIRNPYSGTGLSKLKIGDILTIEIKIDKTAGKAYIRLSIETH